MSHASMASEPADAAFAPKTVTRDAMKALWGSALGYAMDGFDLLILGAYATGLLALIWDIETEDGEPVRPKALPRA